jgi:hypothetical protein
MSNPNTNCLKGKKCPKCGSYGPFLITATTVFTANDTGFDDDGPPDYTDTSAAGCKKCGFFGIWKNFVDPEVKS